MRFEQQPATARHLAVGGARRGHELPRGGELLLEAHGWSAADERDLRGGGGDGREKA